MFARLKAKMFAKLRNDVQFIQTFTRGFAHCYLKIFYSKCHLLEISCLIARLKSSILGKERHLPQYRSHLFFSC